MHFIWSRNVNLFKVKILYLQLKYAFFLCNINKKNNYCCFDSFSKIIVFLSWNNFELLSPWGIRIEWVLSKTNNNMRSRHWLELIEVSFLFFASRRVTMFDFYVYIYTEIIGMIEWYNITQSPLLIRTKFNDSSSGNRSHIYCLWPELEQGGGGGTWKLKSFVASETLFRQTPFQKWCTKKHKNRKFLTKYLKAKFTLSINNDIKTLKARIPKHRFVYETLQHSRVSNETTFSDHKCPTKSYKFPAQAELSVF